jgi:hypothetical protein
MYIVAKGHSYISKGIKYSPGSEITAEAFSSEASFLKKVKKGNIVLGETKEALDEETVELKKEAEEKSSQKSGVRLAHEAMVEIAKEGIKIAKEKLKTAKEEEKKAESPEAKAAAAEVDLEKAKE